MVSSVTFRGGGETTGSVAERRIETAKSETTGGVGARIDKDSVFTVDNELRQDTVSFRKGETLKNHKTAAFITAAIIDSVIAFGLAGLAYKYKLVDKIGHEKTKKILRYTDVVTKPCYEACKCIKNGSYDKIVKYFASKK